MSVNKTDVTTEWTVRENHKTKNQTEQYKSDGMLFKEDWEKEYVDRTYLKRAHSDDDNIQTHNDTGMWGIVYVTYWPWSQFIYSDDGEIKEELIKGWTIDFKNDGHAEAKIHTTEVIKDWEVVKRYKPQKLNKKPE